MKLKDYSTCSSSTDIIHCCFQNAMIMFMEEQNLVQSLVVGNYLYRTTYNQAISEKATPNQIFHAYMEIERYCHEHHDCEGELAQMLDLEIKGAFALHGLRIHVIELQKHGRDIHKK